MSAEFIEHPAKRRWHSLTSSFLAMAAFHYRMNELHVAMKKGGDLSQSYVVFGVPRRVFKELQQDPSPGRYYNEHIKGHYRTIERTLPLQSELPGEWRL